MNKKSTFQVFDPSRGPFDGHVFFAALEIIRETIAACERPTLENIAKDLGITRLRLTRLLKATGLWADYQEARKRAFKKYQ